MQIKNRQQLLIFVTVAAVVLFVGDAIIVEPLIKTWKTRRAAIQKLRNDITTGKRLMKHEKEDQALWDARQRRTLTNDVTFAAQQVYEAVNVWANQSGAQMSGYTPQWKPSNDKDKYSTYECHVDASGDIERLIHFVYCAETEPLALRIDSIDLSTKDKNGLQLTLGLQISGLILNNANPAASANPAQTPNLPTK
jgi:hypothetical protein